jgi:LPPG:FO 2-phospho-L-lactate transferase
MCDEAVQTFVRTDGEWRHFQEYMILQRAQPQIEDVEFRGVEQARATNEVLRAIEAAEVIVIGPSNPIASIGPILAVPGLRAALERADAPLVAVSPLVGGRSLKGPTEQFMRWAALEVSDGGIARHYAGLCQGLVVDGSSTRGTPSLSGTILHATDTLMDEPVGRSRLARETVDFARSLAG